jgi:hypothetical protein
LIPIKRLGTGINVSPLLWSLQSHPELWDADRLRTHAPDSPHREASDIFVRYAADPTVAGPHESVWYPCADVIPVKPLVYDLMRFVEGERLGGVLITRIPPGGQVYPHVDRGWHAETYRKFCIQVQSAPGQLFAFECDELEARPGDLYEFRNEYLHTVTNPTPHDRVSLIVCIQTSKVFE